jgi:xanthine dehydrogenase YagR molybdenum-binding subunit
MLEKQRPAPSPARSSSPASGSRCRSPGAWRSGWSQRCAARAAKARRTKAGSWAPGSPPQPTLCSGCRDYAEENHGPRNPRRPPRSAPVPAFRVLIGAADLGTGTWTALTQIAADALQVTIDDSTCTSATPRYPGHPPPARYRESSAGARRSSEAARTLRARLASDRRGTVPPGGLQITAQMPGNPCAEQFAMHSFGAQFAEVRVHQDTGEVRVPRLLGVFAAGRIINPRPPAHNCSAA